MTKTQKAALYLTCCLFTSCSMFNGEIDLRDKDYYLVNSSRSEGYYFTVKKIEVKNDSTTSYSTQIIYLAPGDEKHLGSIDSSTSPKFLTKEKKHINIYDVDEIEKRLSKPKNRKDEIVDELFRRLDESHLEAALSGYDTIINNKNLRYNYTIKEYIDSINPLPGDRYKFKYELTGERKIQYKN